MSSKKTEMIVDTKDSNEFRFEKVRPFIGSDGHLILYSTETNDLIVAIFQMDDWLRVYEEDAE